MMTLKEYKELLMYAVGHSASLHTLKRLARKSKVKHLPARQKLRFAVLYRSDSKSVIFAYRYCARQRTSKLGLAIGNGESTSVTSTANMVQSDFSKLESRILSSMSRKSLNYLTQMSS